MKQVPINKWYDANFDEELVKLRERADDLCFAYNHTHPSDHKRKDEILKELFPSLGKRITLLAPVYVDYGMYTSIGDDTFVNHNVYFMDGGTITIGNHCFIGPNCGFYTANHPLVASDRNLGYEIAKPIIIEDNVWIGADVTILPGVTIGKGSVIGAKSLVTKDVPANVVAYGNPCRVVREITEKDKIEVGDCNE
ncbi:MAG: sugar O-acetyltransferase [Erysipelotrichaceae bacterium]|nr:sugar O-acetyltransferase [Erysipelotrichaceae bacterium]